MARISRFLAPVMVLALLLSAVAVVLPAQQVLALNEAWTVSIPFTTSSSLGQNPGLKFGTAVGATDDYDVGIDLVGPPAAPGVNPVAVFTINNVNFPELNEDYRAPFTAAGQTRQWSLYTFAPAGTTKTLTWGDISGLIPVDVSLVLTGGGQTINMRTATLANFPAGTHTITITATQLGAPSTVWVDNDWAGNSAGDPVNGYIFGYNAFDTIQEGIDAVASPGTVNVAAGAYTENLSITKSNISVIGADGAAVTGGCTIDGTTGVTVENLSFTNTVRCLATNPAYLIDLVITITGGTAGIVVDGSPASNTVYIDNPVITGATNGIYVTSDTVIITNPSISVCSVGIYADTNAYVTVSGGYSNSSQYGIYAAQNSQVTVSGMDLANNSTGVYLDSTSQVEVGGCSRIHDNTQYGFYVNSSVGLIANGNNIYNNSTYGVYWTGSGTVPNCEENWWGDVLGPIVAGTSVSPRDGINRNDILYSPWLDAPCNQGGDPVGASAKFKGAPRTGEPGQKVQFTDQSTAAPGCTITEWLWKFGDGSSSTAQNPFHIYLHEGNFTVTLTVWDSCGFEQTVTMKYYITIKKSSRGAGGGAGGDTLEPAKLGVSYLNIDPAQVLPNQEVTISANICNSGEERGTKTVSLMVNGEAVASQSVGVSGGSCQQVVFKTSRAVPGTYQVAIDGMTGEFSVLAPRTVTRNVPSQQQTGLGTAGIIAIIAVIVVLIAALIMVFKKD